MLSFKRAFQKSVYFSPLEAAAEGRLETRWDPLTDLTSRIIHVRRTTHAKVDVEEMVTRSLASNCPFCPENVESMTCKFDRDTIGFERFRKDGVVVIPNLLPFDKYCIVAILSEEHFLDMKELADGGYVGRAIRALLEVLRIIVRVDGSLRYLSINWNYLPMSGSSVLHPHMQAIAGEYPTNYHGLMMRKSAEFYRQYGAVFWDVLVEEERRLGERFVGEIGHSSWYVPFAPRGTFDIGGIFQARSILQLGEGEVDSISEGLRRILRFFDNEGMQGFNFSLYSACPDDEHFRVNLRIVARRFIPPVNAADSNYLDRLHGEYVSYVSPEDVARELRRFWQRP